MKEYIYHYHAVSKEIDFNIFKQYHGILSLSFRITTKENYEDVLTMLSDIMDLPKSQVIVTNINLMDILEDG